MTAIHPPRLRRRRSPRFLNGKKNDEDEDPEATTMIRTRKQDEIERNATTTSSNKKRRLRRSRRKEEVAQHAAPATTAKVSTAVLKKKKTKTTKNTAATAPTATTTVATTATTGRTSRVVRGKSGADDDYDTLLGNKKKGQHQGPSYSLPRTLEESLRRKYHGSEAVTVMGIDEAGRGPLAGPVVVAAVAACPANSILHGIVDSKKIGSESKRQELYDIIMMEAKTPSPASSSNQHADTIPPPSLTWAVAIVDVDTIDRINILQATLLGMRLVARTVIMAMNIMDTTATATINKSSSSSTADDDSTTSTITDEDGTEYPIRDRVCMEHATGGTYIVASRSLCSGHNHHHPEDKSTTAVADGDEIVLQCRPRKRCKQVQRETITGSNNGSNGSNDSTEMSSSSSSASLFHALIDGNRVPDNMPCPSEAIVKGDGREYCIALASIVAKVTRDNLMHEYDESFPEFDLSRHKGYPTQMHQSTIRKLGRIVPGLYRTTFAPLKHMDIHPESGQILDS